MDLYRFLLFVDRFLHTDLYGFLPTDLNGFLCTDLLILELDF